MSPDRRTRFVHPVRWVLIFVRRDSCQRATETGQLVLSDQTLTARVPKALGYAGKRKPAATSICPKCQQRRAVVPAKGTGLSGILCVGAP